MPFTFSHPTIVLPLHFLPKKWFSFTGLIIGSLTPDFEYFIRMKVQSIYSHTLYGIFWFDLPLGLLLAYLFHNVVRNSLFFNSPKVIQSRVLVFTHFNWNLYFQKNWLIVIISLLIGIASHLFWDNFTHEQGYFVKNLAALNNTVTIFNFKIPYWKITQHLSSLIGMLVIVKAIMNLPKNKIQKFYSDKKYWFTLLLIIVFILIIRFSNGLYFTAYGNIIVSTISSALISLIVTPLLIKLKANS